MLLCRLPYARYPLLQADIDMGGGTVGNQVSGKRNPETMNGSHVMGKEGRGTRDGHDSRPGVREFIQLDIADRALLSMSNA